ncbi:MAG TPA: hypothetical protein VNY33_00695, partial [Gaiellaceae bacterium]|nr:hypothetical protein [Gaiellaceae bacterium]
MACVFLVALPLGGGALGATSSGANGDIAYAENGNVLLLSGGTVATGVDPSWSPDGTKLAFAASAGGAIETCVVSTPCSPAALGTATGSEPVWSPDASKIAYVNSGSIHFVTFPGGTDTTFVSGVDPSWSPDGSQLAYVSGGSIFTCTIAGPCGSPTQLVASGTQPAWSPDGQTIAYQSGTNVDVIAAAGGSPHFVGIGTSPNWSPNGDSLVLVTASGQIAVVQGSGSSWGSESARTTGTPADSTPDWQTVAPVRGAAPSIFGTTQTGSLLSATNGTWTGASATGYSYAWQRCDSAGSNCNPIGATSTTYAPVQADVGGRLRIVVTASNAAGSTASNLSNATAVVTQAGVVNPPVNATYPVLSFGTGQTAPLIGNFISTTNGTWSGSFPMTFTYQWKWCDSPRSSCFDIIGATSSFYTVPTIYYGKVLRVQVTATNSAASVSQNSEASPAVSAIPPFLRVTPQITGQNVVDQTLGLTFGTWDGSPAPTFTYSWRRCNPPGDLASCVPIAGATAATY